MLVPVLINGASYSFETAVSILEACRSVGIKIPRFCYHESLSIAGNCRMCLVELNEISKPIVACGTLISPNMHIYTNSPSVLKARENILEFLLLNHPLDCPICDQGGECDLQDQALFFGSHMSRNFFNKRGVEDKNLSHVINTVMSRCIHCTKCVRFAEEICNFKTLSMLNRGVSSEIGNYVIKLSLSELSGNLIDLCPVGALTLKTVPFQIRPWEIKLLESIDLSDGLGSNIYLSYKGTELLRITPKKNPLINDSWITNKARFYFELMIKASHDLNFTKTVSDSFSHALSLPMLFLLNSDLDLKLLYTLKNTSNKILNLNVRLLLSAPKKTNVGFWNNKPSIKALKKNYLYTFFLINTNLTIENPLLNIRLKSKIFFFSKVFMLSSFHKSSFPSKFVRFALKDLLEVIRGAHRFFSKFFFFNECIFFTNKTFNDRIDCLTKDILLLHDIKVYSISNFCNSEGATILNFKKFNLKELKFSNQVFGLSLDDTYIIRKFLPIFKQFFWVNQFPSSLLSFLPSKAWFKLDVNQCPGFYINFEQRVQKFQLIYSEYKLCSLKFLLYIASFLTISSSRSFFFNSFRFKTRFWVLNDLKETYEFPDLFNFKLLKFNLHLHLFKFFSRSVFKKLPFKSLIEDPYRSSLQLKFVRTLIKSSQLLRLEVLLK